MSDREGENQTLSEAMREILLIAADSLEAPEDPLQNEKLLVAEAALTAAVTEVIVLSRRSTSRPSGVRFKSGPDGETPGTIYVN